MNYSRTSIRLETALSLVFCLLVAFIFLGPNPLVAFSSSDTAVDGEEGIARRVILVALMATATILALRRDGLRSLSGFPLPLLALLGWAGVTLIWSDVFLVGLRRFVLAAGVTVSLFMLLRALTLPQSIRLLYRMVFWFLVVDLIAVLLLPGAVHPPGSADQALVGLWKGVHPHKNIAASVAFCGIALSLSGVHRSFLTNIVLFSMASVVAFKAGSKTVLILLPFILFSCKAFVFLRARGLLSKAAAIILFLITLICLGTILHQNIELIIPKITEPGFFTGRGQLWNASISYSLDNPWGSGFGSFWDVGPNSPASMYIPANQAMAPHGHNGYFDSMATMGFFGLALVLFACLIHPLMMMSTTDAHSPMFYFIILLLTFFVAGNITESNILSGGRIDWLYFLIALTGLVEQRETARIQYKKFSVK